MAKLLKCDPSNYGKYENGKVKPSYSVLVNFQELVESYGNFTNFDKNLKPNVRPKNFPEKIKILGTVGASPLNVWNQDEDEAFSEDFFPKDLETFGLKVVGNSMLNFGIIDGCLLVCKRFEGGLNDWVNGTIGVVCFNEETTVKKVYAYSDRVILRNGISNDIEIKPVEFDYFKIQAIVVSSHNVY